MCCSSVATVNDWRSLRWFEYRICHFVECSAQTIDSSILAIDMLVVVLSQLDFHAHCTLLKFIRFECIELLRVRSVGRAVHFTICNEKKREEKTSHIFEKFFHVEINVPNSYFSSLIKCSMAGVLHKSLSTKADYLHVPLFLFAWISTFKTAFMIRKEKWNRFFCCCCNVLFRFLFGRPATASRNVHTQTSTLHRFSLATAINFALILRVPL